MSIDSYTDYNDYLKNRNSNKHYNLAYDEYNNFTITADDVIYKTTDLSGNYTSIVVVDISNAVGTVYKNTYLSLLHNKSNIDSQILLGNTNDLSETIKNLTPWSNWDYGSIRSDKKSEAIDCFKTDYLE
tara:strand:+ start:326 stop:712 length:387 start_codon:yes stop_codon:yes gene_type:complete